LACEFRVVFHLVVDDRRDRLAAVVRSQRLEVEVGLDRPREAGGERVFEFALHVDGPADHRNELLERESERL
jgi:hypothetical protein